MLKICEMVNHQHIHQISLSVTISPFPPFPDSENGTLKKDSNKQTVYFEGFEASHYRTGIEMLDYRYNKCIVLDVDFVVE